MNLIISLVMLLCSIPLQNNEKGILVDKTIVEVEKEAITLLDLDAHSKIQIVLSEGPVSLYKIGDSGFINAMINLMINRELVSQELRKEKKYKPTLYNKEAENLFIKTKAKFSNAKDFEKFLSDINMNETEFKKTLSVYIMIDDFINKITEEKIKIDEDELVKYMQANGIVTPADTETQNKYRNELRAEKKKNYASQYLEELKNRYRIRYLYVPK
ncbi:MAG: hypothetical protein N3B13_09720 [Deltaproteobacteria bacterium]|nr:hypothetical protein [Deltaproteobacteria bacterium]